MMTVTLDVQEMENVKVMDVVCAGGDGLGLMLDTLPWILLLESRLAKKSQIIETIKLICTCYVN